MCAVWDLVAVWATDGGDCFCEVGAESGQVEEVVEGGFMSLDVFGGGFASDGVQRVRRW